MVQLKAAVAESRRRVDQLVRDYRNSASEPVGVVTAIRSF